MIKHSPASPKRQKEKKWVLVLKCNAGLKILVHHVPTSNSSLWPLFQWSVTQYTAFTDRSKARKPFPSCHAKGKTTLPIVYNQSKGKSILSIMKNCGNSFHHSTNKAAGKLILAPETFKGLGRQDITLVTNHGTWTLSTAERVASFPCPKVSELWDKYPVLQSRQKHFKSSVPPLFCIN